MKDLLLQYARYNIWANNLLIDAMLQLPDGKIDKPITSSFKSLRSTTYHCWSAEDIWLQRLMLVESPIWAEGIFKGSFADACYNWQLTSKGLEHFVTGQNEDALNSNLSFSDRKGNPHENKVAHVLLHVFNHATYHRGQLTTLLRQVGEVNIPGTDFIAFTWR